MKILSKDDVKSLYQKKIVPRIARLERDRKATLRNLALVMGGTLFCAFRFGHGFFSASPQVFFAVLIGALVVEYQFITKAYVKRYKNLVVKEILNALVPGCEYDPESHVSPELFRSSELVDEFHEFSGEDYMEGQFGNLKLEFSEVKAIRVDKNSKGQKKKAVVFQGLFFSFKLPMNLRQRTLILPDYAEQILGRNLGRMIQKGTRRSGYDLVQTESLEFEKRYLVYSDDQVRSRVLLRPAVMENLTSFKKKYQQEIEVSIQGSMLYLGIQTHKDHFEPKLFGTAVSFKDIREIYDLLRLVQDLQEDLELQVAS